MILYHGSNVIVTHVDLGKSKPGKDFGKGFYLSDNYEQAFDMAKFRSQIMGGEPVVSVFDFQKDEAFSASDMRILTFDGYTDQWADFVFKNRNSPTAENEYDFVYGPIANDRVGLQIRKLKDGQIDRTEFLHRLMYMKGMTFQYFFGSERALSFLTPKQ